MLKQHLVSKNGLIFEIFTAGTIWRTQIRMPKKVIKYIVLVNRSAPSKQSTPKITAKSKRRGEILTTTEKKTRRERIKKRLRSCREYVLYLLVLPVFLLIKHALPRTTQFKMCYPTAHSWAVARLILGISSPVEKESH